MLAGALPTLLPAPVARGDPARTAVPVAHLCTQSQQQAGALNASGCAPNPTALHGRRHQRQHAVRHRATAAAAGSQNASETRLRLVMMRHAESEDAADSTARDHDRQITAAGRQAAQQVAQQLADLGWVADLVICSDSTRTRQTLEAMQEARVGLEAAKVHLRGDLYTIAALDGQTRSHLQGIIAEETAGFDARCILAMGHNKGWSEAASSFTGEKVKLGPCTAALLDQHAASWEEAFHEREASPWGLVCTISAGTAAFNKATAEEITPLDRPAFG